MCCATLYGMEGTPLKTMLRERGMRMNALARLLGVDKATVTRWVQSRVPAERVLEIEKNTGISRTEIRPDLYPSEAA